MKTAKSFQEYYDMGLCMAGGPCTAGSKRSSLWFAAFLCSWYSFRAERPTADRQEQKYYAAGVTNLSTNTNSIHINFRLILRWQHPQSQVNDAQGILCYIPAVKTCRVSSQPSPLTPTQAQYNSSAVRQPIRRIYEKSQIGIRNVKQWTVQSTKQGSTRHIGSRVFSPSFPIFKSLTLIMLRWRIW